MSSDHFSRKASLLRLKLFHHANFLFRVFIDQLNILVASFSLVNVMLVCFVYNI